MNELISVIIPCYNVEKYIDRCMKSVLGQTYQELEIILIDDGSTDSTADILNSYLQRDKRIKLLRQSNKGAGAARNYGLESAKGRYIGFVDSDDWIALDMYEYLMNLLQDGNADIVACDYFSTKKYVAKRSNESEKITIMDNNKLMEYFFRIHGEKSCYSVCNMLYRIEVISSFKFPEGNITEDLLFNYRVYSNCNKYILSNRKKYYYFVNSNGVTRKILGEKDLALLNNWDIIIEDTKIRNSKMTEYAVMNRYRADFTLLSKAVLYGYDENEISKVQLKRMLVQVKRHRRYLIRSKVLDWKRILLLIFICYRYRLGLL